MRTLENISEDDLGCKRGHLIDIFMWICIVYSCNTNQIRRGCSRVCDYKRWYVYYLVALYFVPNPDGKEYVNHKDENKGNNRADNLEWCDWNYNLRAGALVRQRRILQPRRSYMVELLTVHLFEFCQNQTQQTHYNPQWPRKAHLQAGIYCKTGRRYICHT